MEFLDNYLPKDLINIIDEYMIDCTQKDIMIKQLNARFNRFSKILDWNIVHHDNLLEYSTKYEYANGEIFSITNSKLAFIRQVKLEKHKLYWLNQGEMNEL